MDPGKQWNVVEFQIKILQAVHSYRCWPEDLERPARRCNIFPVWIHLSPSAQNVAFQEVFSGCRHLILAASWLLAYVGLSVPPLRRFCRLRTKIWLWYDQKGYSKYNAVMWVSEIGWWSVIIRRTTGSLSWRCLGNSLWWRLWSYRCYSCLLYSRIWVRLFKCIKNRFLFCLFYADWTMMLYLVRRNTAPYCIVPHRTTKK